MQYGLCHLRIVPFRQQPADTIELVSPVLIGEVFKVLDYR